MAPKKNLHQVPTEADPTRDTMEVVEEHEEEEEVIRVVKKKRVQILQNPQLMEAYTAMKTAVEAVNQDLPENGETLEAIACPSLVVTGTQSAGKTTFIETMTGFPVGPTTRGTGTRCPVRYILRPSLTPFYKVDGQKVDSRYSLRQAVSKKMKTYQERGEFSDKAIEVQICEEQVLNIDITDLPGLKTEGDEDQSKISDIVSKHLCRPDVIPVVLTYAQKSPDNQHDMQPLLKAGLKLENSIVIVNGVNDTLRHIYTVPEINNYFREYRECGFFKGSRAVRFVMFLPTLKQTVNVESMGPQQIEQFYNDLPDKEMQDLQDYLNSKDVDGDYFGLDASVTSAFGVSSAHQALLDVLQNWTESNGEKTAHVLQDRLAPLAAQRRRIEAEIGKRKVRLAETETNISAYADKYLSTMAKLRKNEEVTMESHDRTSNFPGVLAPFGKSRIGAYTYEQEVKMLPSNVAGASTDPYAVWKPLDVLKQKLGVSHTGQSLDQKLTCDAAIRRLIRLVSFQIMDRPLDPYSLDQIASKHKSPGGLMNQAAPATIIQDLVSRQLREVFQEVFPRLLEHVRVLCEIPTRHSHQALEEAFHQDVSKLHDLQDELDVTFSRWLDTALANCNDHLNAMLKEKMTSFPVDIDCKMIQLLRLAPLDDSRDIIPDLVGAEPGDASARDPVEEDPDECRTPKKQDFQTGDHKQTLGYDVYKKVRAVIQQVHPKKDAQLAAIIDFVEGGLTGIPAAEWREEAAVVNKIGEKFFLILKGQMVMELQSKINLHVAEEMSHSRGSDDSLHAFIRSAVEEYKAKKEYKEKLEKVLDTTGLQEQLDNKKVQERKIKEVIRTLSVNLYSSFTQQMARI